ncbi:hypothetical protein AGMMS4957_11030 [Bacteroidia bacterium]|nr:hypothetical protein AGMMS4957_11030 [Bacteroidia bacterium]
MKKMNVVQMENLQGGRWVPDGWQWSVEEHIGCAIGGFLAGGGVGGVVAYGACLLICS